MRRFAFDEQLRCRTILSPSESSLPATAAEGSPLRWHQTTDLYSAIFLCMLQAVTIIACVYQPFGDETLSVVVLRSRVHCVNTANCSED